MKFTKALYVAPLLALLSLPALAYPGGQGYRYQQRVEHQGQRIQQDARSGQPGSDQLQRQYGQQGRAEAHHWAYGHDRHQVLRQHRQRGWMFWLNSRFIAHRGYHNQQRPGRWDRHSWANNHSYRGDYQRHGRY